MHAKGTRVGHYLVWLVVVVSVPLLGLTAGTIWRVQQAQHRQQEVALLGVAREAAQSIDRTFDRVEIGLRALAVSSALQREDLDDFKHEIVLMSARLGDMPISLIGRDGRPVLQVPPDGTTLTDGVFTAPREAEPVVTNLLAGSDPAHRALAIVVPVTGVDNAVPSRFLVAAIDSNRLIQMADPPGPNPAGMVIRIRDRDGVTAARSAQPGQYIGEPARPGFMAGVSGRQSGLLADTTPLDGQPAIRAFSLTGASGYIVSVGVPESAFGAGIRQDLLNTVLIGAGLLLLGVFAAVYLGRRLVAALRVLERGDTASIPPSGLREVDELAVRLKAVAGERDTKETTLRESEERLRDLVGTLDLAAIMVRELTGAIRFWSHGCARMYGWTVDEAVGRMSHDLLRTEFPVSLVRIEQTLLAVGEWKGDLIHHHRDGRRIVVAAHKALKRGPDGQPQTVMESLVDVTALREAQDALGRLNQNLEQRVRTEVTARQAAQNRAAHADRVQALGQLAGGIAHDFNNVLQAVAGGAALIARRPGDAECVGRMVNIIGDAAARGASITRRMLLLARRGDLQAEPVEAGSLLDGIREVFIHTLGAAIEVRVDVAPGLPALFADKAQLETALVNLGTNARDAMPDGGILSLSATLDEVTGDAGPHIAGLPSGDYVRLTVTDDGTGMGRATLARLGEPFFTTKEVGKGTGLGLSMVKGFADQSGGGFAVESQLGSGTTVTLWLPVAPENQRQPLRANTELDTRARTTGRILLVDDDPLVRDTVIEQLEELGHKVLAASGGTDALAILQAREAVDLMITDLSMPGMNGLTLIREARGLRPNLPAILLTGHSGDSMSLEGVGVSPDSYSLLRKPATSAVLAARVTALLERL